jgi:hypothetical protein
MAHFPQFAKFANGCGSSLLPPVAILRHVGRMFDA